MAYGAKTPFSKSDNMESRPRAASGARGKDRNGSTKGDVGMSPRASQGPGNHGGFAQSIARKNGVSFKGDPMKGGGYA